MRRAKYSILQHVLMLLLLLLLAGYLLLPYGVRHGLETLLREQGLTEVDLADVDVEPFGGELRLIGLSARGGDGSTLALGEGYLNIDWISLGKRRGLLQGLALQGLELTLEQDSDGLLRISGIPVPPATGGETGDSPWGFGIDRLTITDSRLQLRLPGFAQLLTLRRLQLTGLHSWDADTPAQLELVAGLDDANIRLDGQLTPFAAEPGSRGSLRVTGLDIARLTADLADSLPSSIAQPAGTIDLDLQISAHLAAGQAMYEQQGKVSVRDLQITSADQPQAIGKIDWDGKLGWSAQAGVAADGSLGLRNAALAQQGRRIALDELDWQGKAGWSPDAGARADGHLQAAGLVASQPAQQLLLASLKRLDAQALQLGEGNQLTLQGATLDGIVVLDALDAADVEPRLAATRLTLGATRLAGTEAIELGRIGIQGAKLHIERDGTGKLPLVARLTAATPPAQAPAATKSPGPRLVLAGLHVGKDSSISFVDHSVQPSFRQRLDIEQLSVGRIDSAADAWTPVDLAGSLGEYSRLSLAGKAKPLADKVNVDLTGTLKAVELPPLSSYAAAKLGYTLQSGQLDSDIAIKITDDQLDGEAKLVVNKLNVKAADPDLAGRLTRELSMPLDSALNMLRDGDDNIRLTLPVSGDIHKPDFDLSNIINKALGSALKSAAFSYLKYALQPYGSLITLAQIAGKAANRVALDPLSFPAGSAAPAADASPYLDKLQGLLTSRPQLRIQICGLATEADRLALAALEKTKAASPGDSGGTRPATPAIDDDRLLKLAEERAANIKRALVERGAGPERLFVCNPEIDKDPKAEPRAQLLL